MAVGGDGLLHPFVAHRRGILRRARSRIYLLAIREGVERIRDQVETVYDVARAAKEGYEWLTDKFLLFMKLREMRK